MLIIEIRKFFRRYRFTGIVAIAVLAAGMAASSLLLSILWAVSNHKIPGLAEGSFATIGEAPHGGPLRPLPWETLERAQGSIPSVVGYGQSIKTTVRSAYQERTIAVAAASSAFFKRFQIGLSPADSRLSFDSNQIEQRWIVLTQGVAESLFGNANEAVGQFLTIEGIRIEVIAISRSGFGGLFGQEVSAWVSPSCVAPLYVRLSEEMAQDKHINSAEVWKKAAVFYGVAPVSSPGVARLWSAALRTDLRLGHRLVAVAGLTIDPERDRALIHWLKVALTLAVALTASTGLSFGAFLLARAPRQGQEVRFKRVLGGTVRQIMLGLCAGPLSAIAVAFALSVPLDFLALSALRRSVTFSSFITALHILNPLWASIAQLPLILFLSVVMALVPAARLLRDAGAPRIAAAVTDSKRQRRMIFGLVACQVLGGLGVAVSAAVVAKSGWDFASQSTGLQAEHRSVLRVDIKPGTREFSFKAQSEGSFPMSNAAAQILTDVPTIPGVRGVALANSAVMEPASSRSLIVSTAHVEERSVEASMVSASWFSLIGARFLSGSSYTEGVTGEVQECVVNRKLARQLWPAGAAVGSSVDLKDPSSGLQKTVRVVGVIADQRYYGPGLSISPTIFLPLRGELLGYALPMFVLVNGEDSTSNAAQILTINRILDADIPGLAVTNSFSVQSRLQEMVTAEIERVLPAILGALAILVVMFASLSTCLGYSTQSRTREFAIRMACGATPGNIVSLVLLHVLISAGIAVLLSVLSWGFLRRFVLSGLDVDVSSWSSGLAAIVTVFFLLAVILTALAPAIRASRSSVAVSLRE